MTADSALAPAARDGYVDAFGSFVQASPSSFHAAARVTEVLAGHGFVELLEADEWPAGAGRYVVRRDGAVVAWIVPKSARSVTPFRIIGAHTDSPALKLKPGGGSFGASGWLQASVEVYGGPIVSSWFDRDLEFAGRIVMRDGRENLVRTGAIARVPHLAIHLDRSVNDGFAPDRQLHLQPVYGVGASGEPLIDAIGSAAGLDPADIAGYDLVTADTQPPARIGLGGELLAAGRMDNLSSVFAGLDAMTRAGDDSGHIRVLAAFDHEEVGSGSRSGAAGSLLEDVLARISGGLGASSEDRARADAGSWLLSMDAGHVVHPNYADRHDPHTAPRPGAGPLLKINANQRYATDARGEALWSNVCRSAGIGFQPFVSNNDVPCGSTIGPITSTRLGISTLDVGVGLLSMHSVRELVHVDDLYDLSLAARAFLAE